ncbi:MULTISPECIES: leucyl/phenylalanyl-tRNA--protein transferase [Pseudomonadaceae]|uniref:Leucyl/phenylalanyl-tRNA--protein transferase n=2 Tax=Pseudomonadaceae TaxID=135621 RepID=A0ABX3IMQ2_9PSED|nr:MULTISPECIES: leucyl/phenylalanyl-tRNA--protein transferase [Pseudomonas]MBA1258560.1 leucyl/phenylalanyl-tRNA--protein transferase [Pseudomonas psychrotolerans]ONN69166.1 leucyl/phenylalanyl-tRNA--protein transferase [Pseudomonas psychrotolerans]RAU39311.1 leucyl/phenylalanyl-tRNA--protein transferase [Pseudomonas sp. RIT 411]RED00745.1 leucyl/phenylalanyl-tRNA--protein transferase [Pseudomonas oleovorans]
MVKWLTRESPDFPPLQQALREPNGLLAIGGDLSAARLISAYRHGCFPWYQAGQPLLWWSPDPRTVLFPPDLHVSRSLAKTLRKTPLRVTYDQAFERVILACAGPRRDADGTWITAEMRQAYQQLHTQGWAHSVEVWDGDQLVGGLYGIAMGKLFFGESMFSHVDNASKIGFVTLVRDLAAWGFVMIDCQMQTAHLQSLGASSLSRERFSEYLAKYLDQASMAAWPTFCG